MKKHTSKPQPTPVTITMPPQDYQPSKAEKEQVVKMPEASLKTMKEAFFRPVKVKVKAVKKGTKTDPLIGIVTI